MGTVGTTIIDMHETKSGLKISGVVKLLRRITYQFSGAPIPSPYIRPLFTLWHYESHLPLVKFDKNITLESIGASYFLTIDNGSDSQPIVHSGVVVAPNGMDVYPLACPNNGQAAMHRKSRKGGGPDLPKRTSVSK